MDKIKEIFKLFFSLGLFAFGGPAAHIAMLHKEVVDKRKWMDEKHFLDLVGATSLIPGPNSTEMVIHSGFYRGGILGLFTAGISFILPACFITYILAYLYQLSFQVPNIDQYFIGIKAAVLILIWNALKKLWKKAAKSFELSIVAFLVFTISFLGYSEALSLFFGTLIGFAIIKLKAYRSLTSIEPFSIFTIFLKIGSILFGSGYVLIAYLQDELVENKMWLTSAQLADAIAIGQFTPGPVLSTSTFIGYLLANELGAIIATIGIFLPSFLFVLILNPLIPKMRSSKNFSILLDSVNASAIGIMAYALIPISKVAFINWIGITIFICCTFIIWKFPKLNSITLVLFASTMNIILVSLSNIT
ncbi:MAG: chromate transporter [Bacteriovoracaceae bacterium]|jgi:chromate transporter|nr:chromate transporter [Bacteriovoracaceae bacterium]